MTVNIEGAVVLVTGANGGLGREFVEQALDRGAAKVYATARSPREWDDTRVVPLTLDVTDVASIEAAAQTASDTTVVINNAGITVPGDRLTSSSIDDIRATFETNFFGAIQVVRGFAPVLGANGGGAFVDVHSVLSWIGLAGSYSASKAAFWSATNSFRLELAPQGTHVLGLHLGYTDTPMVAAIEAEKNDPADIVRLAYDGLEAGEYEVLADELSATVKAGLSARIEDLYTDLVR
jgi:NAD(P)-dependent dehydrogenase (short-subunit alcohol dehydrogenase family)